RLRCLRCLAVSGIEIGQYVLDRGDVGLRRFLAHRSPRRVDRVVKVGLAVVLTHKSIDFSRSARGDGRNRAVRHDRGQHPGAAWSQLFQELPCEGEARTGLAGEAVHLDGRTSWTSQTYYAGLAYFGWTCRACEASEAG